MKASPGADGGGELQFMYILTEERGRVMSEDAIRRTGEYAMDLLGKGKLVGGAPLRPQSEAKRVRKDGETARVMDGPFTETKEIIAGYMLIEAESLAEAVELARDCPNAEFGTVEVREIIPMG